MKIARVLTAAALGVVVSTASHAATLNMTVTSDNAYSIYLSSDDSVLGTLVGSNYEPVPGPAGQWQTPSSYSAALSVGTNFIHVVGINYTLVNGLWTTPGTTNGGGDNPDGFLGQFSITGGGFSFTPGGGTTLETNSSTGQWRGYSATGTSPWVTPTAAVLDFGANGVAPWGTLGSISTSAHWIWSDPDGTGYAYLSTAILSTGNAAAPTPLPAALPLYASGMGVLGFLGWRRRKRTAKA